MSDESAPIVTISGAKGDNEPASSAGRFSISKAVNGKAATASTDLDVGGDKRSVDRRLLIGSEDEGSPSHSGYGSVPPDTQMQDPGKEKGPVRTFEEKIAF